MEGSPERYGSEIAQRLRRTVTRDTPHLRYRGSIYRSGLWDAEGRWLVGWDGAGDAAGTVFVQVKQSGLDRLADARTVALALLSDGVRPSRVDLYVDHARAGSPRPRSYWAALPGSVCRVSARHRVLMVDGTGRETVALGARGGRRHLRIYDRPDGASVRHELEMRAERARTVGEAMLVEPLEGIWQREYGAFVQWRSVASQDGLEGLGAG